MLFKARKLFDVVWKKLIDFNVYKNALDTEDDENPTSTVLRIELWATRLFLFLMFVSVIVFIVVSAVSKSLTTVTIDGPTIDSYRQVHSRFGDEVQCPCSRIDAPLASYVNVTKIFHPICSSHFISQTWIDQSFSANISYTWPMDARTIISAYGQLLHSLC